MKPDEMITILEEIAPRRGQNPSARCTAVRTFGRSCRTVRAADRTRLDDELERLIYDDDKGETASG